MGFEAIVGNIYWLPIHQLADMLVNEVKVDGGRVIKIVVGGHTRIGKALIENKTL